MSVTQASPSQLPAGYKLRHRLPGDAAGGFPADADQVTLIHTRGWRHSDVAFPLAVFLTSALDQPLIGTNGRKGTPIDLGVAGTTAIYHDGMWQVDGEALPAVGLQQARHWRTELVHSITVYTAKGTVGVRAHRDVPLDELVAVARSLEMS